MATWMLVLAGVLVTVLLAVHTARVVRGDGYGHRPGPPSHHGAWCTGWPPCGCE